MCVVNKLPSDILNIKTSKEYHITLDCICNIVTWTYSCHKTTDKWKQCYSIHSIFLIGNLTMLLLLLTVCRSTSDSVNLLHSFHEFIEYLSLLIKSISIHS